MRVRGVSQLLRLLFPPVPISTLEERAVFCNRRRNLSRNSSLLYPSLQTPSPRHDLSRPTSRTCKVFHGRSTNFHDNAILMSMARCRKVIYSVDHLFVDGSHSPSLLSTRSASDRKFVHQDSLHHWPWPTSLNRTWMALGVISRRRCRKARSTHSPRCCLRSRPIEDGIECESCEGRVAGALVFMRMHRVGFLDSVRNLT